MKLEDINKSAIGKAWMYDSKETKNMTVYYQIQIENNIQTLYFFHKSILVTEVYDYFVYSQRLKNFKERILPRVTAQMKPITFHANMNLKKS